MTLTLAINNNNPGQRGLQHGQPGGQPPGRRDDRRDPVPDRNPHGPQHRQGRADARGCAYRCMNSSCHSITAVRWGEEGEVAMVAGAAKAFSCGPRLGETSSEGLGERRIAFHWRVAVFCAETRTVVGPGSPCRQDRAHGGGPGRPHGGRGGAAGVRRRRVARRHPRQHCAAHGRVEGAALAAGWHARTDAEACAYCTHADTCTHACMQAYAHARARAHSRANDRTGPRATWAP